MEDEHEQYGGEIPEGGEEAEADLDGVGEEAQDGGKEDVGADDPTSKELDEMKKRLKEMEEEAAALREMQARVEREMSGGADAGAPVASREEADARSVFVGNVDYACTPEEVQQHFQSCGTVNRVTILTDKFGQPKGFAYVEFLETEAVQNGILLNDSELHGRQIKVTAKRTNLPGLKAYRGRRGPSGFASPYRPRRPSPYGAPYGAPYGRVPRYRRPARYRPYY
eukprot:TRINITY_DN39427_c0_g1_i1.p1 TRINITY_DN39427_c0_g1~~TRINITY_DN39427_c0_g1_i1.p1  ORF type:complete len:262 (-),score=49.05 TRINITY_DN39427_c0_g1_i1:468-1142(-)